MRPAAARLLPLALLLVLLPARPAPGQVQAPALATIRTADGSFVVRLIDPATVATVQQLIDGTAGPLGVLGEWRTGNRGYNRNGRVLPVLLALAVGTRALRASARVV